MRVLVACEESQAVTKAFRAKGHEAYSCDIQQCALYDHIEWHIVEDARKLINGNCCFETVNGERHKIKGGWDLLIAHPPCTYLTASSAIRLFSKDHQIKDKAREAKGWEARAFFMALLEADCPPLQTPSGDLRMKHLDTTDIVIIGHNGRADHCRRGYDRQYQGQYEKKTLQSSII